MEKLFSINADVFVEKLNPITQARWEVWTKRRGGCHEIPGSVSMSGLRQEKWLPKVHCLLSVLDLGAYTSSLDLDCTSLFLFLSPVSHCSVFVISLQYYVTSRAVVQCLFRVGQDSRPQHHKCFEL